ncbi:MAG: hypothetical protein FRX49_12580 [Trebouxia sp. A1-2]|nr:MAG: hypothetical protein FRX49_12580 [Trebouxia sp. A1-2]
MREFSPKFLESEQLGLQSWIIRDNTCYFDSYKQQQQAVQHAGVRQGGSVAAGVGAGLSRAMWKQQGFTLGGYLGQLGVRGAIEGGNSIHVSLLPCQEAKGPSHAESHATNLH